MLQKKFQKEDFKFHCEKCNYFGKRKSQYERHLQTIKHKNNECYKKATEKVQYICLCGKKFKHHSSFYRHKKECKHTEPETLTTEATVDLVKTLINQNQKLQEQIQDIIPKLSDTNKTTNINSNNNIINVQMFLNDKCADAMSIQNFANQLLITMDDLTKSKKDCISNVVLKNLKPLALTERPFHCTDINNKSWFVKDETEGWEEDDGEKLIKNTEYGIQKKWCDEFVKRYPQWMKDDAAKDRYIKIAGSTTAALDERTKLKLLRELATETTLNTGELTV